MQAHLGGLHCVCLAKHAWAECLRYHHRRRASLGQYPLDQHDATQWRAEAR